MPLPKHIQPSFAAGELSPSLWGRTDLAKYHVGAAELTNFFVHPEGGASNRAGMKYVGSTPWGVDSRDEATSLLIPFQYNVEHAYALMIVVQGSIVAHRMYVIKDGAFVHTPAGDGVALSGTVWWASSVANEWYLRPHSLALAAKIQEYITPSAVYADVGGADTKLEESLPGRLVTGQWGWGDNDSIGNYNTIYVYSATDPNLDPAGYWEAEFPLNLATPYAFSTDLSLLRYTQSADTMYFVHPDYPPYKLTRASDTSWTFTALVFSPTVATPATPVTAFWGNSLGWSQDRVEYKVSAVDSDTGEESLASALVRQAVNLPWQAYDRVSVVWNSLVTAGVHTWSVHSGNIYKIALTTQPDSVWTGFGPQRELLPKAASLAAMTQGSWWWGSNVLYLWFSSTGWYYWRGWDPQVKPNGFVRWHVNGKQYNVYKNSRGYFGWVGTVEGAEFIDDNVDPDVSDGVQIANAPFGSANNYPGAVGIFEQRLVFARTNNEPQTVWASVTGNYENLSTSSPLKATDAIEVTIASQQVNEVRHIVPLESLLLFTSGAEWLMTHGSNSDALSPTSVQFKLQGYRGCNEVPPLVIGNSVLFAQRNSQSVREIAYSFESDGYATTDISVLSQHLFAGRTVVDWAYQQEPFQLVWVVMSDGALLTFTYVKEQQVWAWAKHNTDAAAKTSRYGPGVRSITCIPGELEDDVYLTLAWQDPVSSLGYTRVVKVDTRGFQSVEDSVFCDQAWTYNAPIDVLTVVAASPAAIRLDLPDGTCVPYPRVSDLIDVEGILGNTTLNGNRYRITSINAINPLRPLLYLEDPTTGDPINGTGFAPAVAYTGIIRIALTAFTVQHLSGLAVVYLADGIPGSLTVGSLGEVVLPTAASRVAVGLPYTADLQTLDLESGGDTVKGRTKNSPRATLQLERTRGGKIGTTVDTLEEIRYDEDADYDDTGTMTGAKDTVVAGRWDRAGRIMIRQDKPLPITVAAIAREVMLDNA